MKKQDMKRLATTPTSSDGGGFRVGVWVMVRVGIGARVRFVVKVMSGVRVRVSI